MLDIKYIRENSELVEKGNRAKNFNVDINKILALDSEIRPLQQELENLQKDRNSFSKEIMSVSPSEREVLKEKVTNIKKQMEQLTTLVQTKKDELDQLLLFVAQPARSDVPFGKDDSDNVVLEKWGTPRTFDFPYKDHIKLGEELDILDFERGVKLSGSRSYVLKGDGALLESAILRFTFEMLIKNGFTPMSVPVLVNEDAMTGTGYFPTGRDQAYLIEKDKLVLVGTSEVSLCGIHAGEILDEKTLPRRYMAQTSCFRREAGSYGKDTKGLYRVHQFQKIEMVIMAPANKEQTDQFHDELLHNAESVLRAFELPYRKVYVCTGDLGQGQVRKHDLETWMPSRNNYGETHSCSSFYDFQSRRLNLRYKDKEGNKHFVYTLNNTACAAPRLVLAIMENFQTKDGRIEIPKVLRPYMGGKVFIEKFNTN